MTLLTEKFPDHQIPRILLQKPQLIVCGLCFRAFKTGALKMYRIETTDSITGNTLTQLMDMPFVIKDVKIEGDKDDTLIIYFESRLNRDLYPMALNLSTTP